MPERRPPKREANDMNFMALITMLNSLDAVISETCVVPRALRTGRWQDGKLPADRSCGLVLLSGDIQGRIILDMDAAAASQAFFRYFRHRRRSLGRTKKIRCEPVRPSTPTHPPPTTL